MYRDKPCCELFYVKASATRVYIHAMVILWATCWHPVQVRMLYLLFKLIHKSLELISVLSHLIQLTLCLSQLSKHQRESLAEQV